MTSKSADRIAELETQITEMTAALAHGGSAEEVSFLRATCDYYAADIAVLRYADAHPASAALFTADPAMIALRSARSAAEARYSAAMAVLDRAEVDRDVADALRGEVEG